MKVNNINTEYYKACESRYGQTIYERVDYVENTDLRKSIAEIKLNNAIIVHSMFPIEYQANGEHFAPPFNE